MKKCNPVKSLWTYSLISVALFLIVFLLFVQTVSAHFSDVLNKFMINEALSIGNLYQEIYESEDKDMEYLRYKLLFLREHFSANILVLDSTGNIIADSLINPNIRETPRPMISQAFKEGTVQVQSRTFLQSGNAPTVTVAAPISSKGEIISVVWLEAHYPSTSLYIFYIYRAAFFTILTLVFLTCIYGLFLQRRTNKTISEMNKTAKEIAQGNFSSRVSFSSRKEFNELAKNMNHMAMELEKLDALRKDFIANISHDFRSPLTSIKGFVQAILDGTIPHENQNKYLNIVLEESERLTHLTNNILLLTKLENNQVPLYKTEFDIQHAIQKACIQFETNILKKNIDIQLLFAKKSLLVFADPNQIYRVLTNILDNAIKFSNEKGQVIIETVLHNDKVEIHISDTGQGISEENIKYIWDRFHKADRSRGMDRKGIGIGLSIVKEIIKSHDEQIDVYSQVNKGTKFVFTLPYVSRSK